MKKMFSKVIAYLMVLMMVFTMVPAMPSYATAENLVTEGASAEQADSVNDAAIELEEEEQAEVPETSIPAESDADTGASPKTTSANNEEIIAEGRCGVDLTWTLDESGKLTISGTGVMYEFSNAPWYDYRGEITSLVLEHGITVISGNAFSNLSNITGNLVIPDSVTTIGFGAFSGCSGFTGNLVIPDSVTSIRNDAFYNCSGFDGNLTLPNNINMICHNTFYGCSGFTGNLIIPDGVETIESQAFYNCSGFTGNLLIPHSVKTIGTNAFYNCSGFDGKLVLGNNVQTIDTNAFNNCSGFTGDLIIPDSVIEIGPSAFSNCGSFTGKLVIGNNIKVINKGTFYECEGLSGQLIIPDNVTEIGSEAFRYCSGFTGELIIPNTVTSLGEHSFYDCNGFETLVISSGVRSLENSVFGQCSNLTQIYIPDNIFSISNSALHRISNATPRTYYIYKGSYADMNQELYCKDIDKIVYMSEEKYTPIQPMYLKFSVSNIAVGEEPVQLADYIIADREIDLSTIEVIIEDENLAMYDDVSGCIIGFEPGTCKITIAQDELNCTADLTVVDGNVPKPTNIYFTTKNIKLDKGTTAYNPLTMSPGGTYAVVDEWTVENKNIASVDSSGRVTALESGETTVTAKIGSYQASYKVSIDQPVMDIFLTYSVETYVMLKGKSEKLRYYPYPYDATDLSEIKFTSDDENVVKIDSDGIMTAVGVGTTNVNLSVNGIERSVNVQVRNPLRGISLNETNVRAFNKDEFDLELIMDPVAPDDAGTPQWSSSNEKVASVDQNGHVTINGIGASTVTVTVNDFTANCTVTGLPVKVTEVVLDATEKTIKYGEEFKLNATKKPSNHTNTKPYIWESNDENIVTVSEDGTVKAVGVGTADIKVTIKDTPTNDDEELIVDICTVIVEKAVPEFVVPEDVTAVIGQTIGDVSLPKGFAWAEPTQDVGLRGDRTFKAIYTPENTDNYLVVEDIDVPVYVRDPKLVSIELDRTIEACIDGEKQLEADVTVQDDAEYEITWEVEDDSIAEISEDGVVIGLKDGETTVTASIGEGLSDSAVLKVSNHRWENEYTVDKEPTCVEEGKESIHCEVCDLIDKESEKALETIDHTVVTDEVVEPTCVKSGLTEGSHCSFCKEVFIAQEEIPMAAHQYGKWYTEKEPTATEDGIERRDCKNCDNHETRTLEKLGTTIDKGSCGENASWRLNDQGTMFITGKGAITDNSGFSKYFMTQYLSNVKIGEGITEIGNDSFKSSGIIGIQFPSTLEVIGDRAFTDCSMMAQIEGTFEIPDGVTSIGNSAFLNCASLYGDLIVPDTVKAIHSNAFMCSGLSGEVVLSKNIDYLGDAAFAYTNITKVTIPNGAKSIGMFAFEACNKLTGDIVIPESVTHLAPTSFYETPNLDNMIILNPDCYMDGCDAECNIVGMKDSTAEEYAVKYGLEFKTICEYYGDEHEYGDWYVHEAAAIGKPGSERKTCKTCGFYEEKENPIVAQGTYSDTASWTLDYEGTFTVSGTGAVSENDSSTEYFEDINKIIIEDGITEIGSHTFAYCKVKESIEIPDSVTKIGEYAFSYCDQYTGELALPKNLTEIGEGAFGYWYGVSGDLVIPEGVTEISDFGFVESSFDNGKLVLHGGITSIGEGAFLGTKFNDVTIPESVETLGDNAFNNLPNVNRVVMLSDDCRFGEGAINTGIVGYIGSTAQKYAKDNEYEFVPYCEHFGHDYDGEWVTEKEANCAETGLQKRNCSIMNCTVPETKEIPKNDNHAWDDSKTIDKQPTCIEEGKASVHCSRCDEVKDTTTIPVTGHSYVSEVIPPTCLADGHTQFTCSNCGDSYKGDFTEMLGHEWNDGTVTIEPQCEVKGQMTYACIHEGCDEIREESIDALGHTPGIIPPTVPTCTETGLTEGMKCTVCDKILAEQKEVPMTGHSYGEWIVEKEPTNTTTGIKYRRCTSCDKIEKVKIDALNEAQSKIYLGIVGNGGSFYVTMPNGEIFTTPECGMGELSAGGYVKDHYKSFSNFDHIEYPYLWGWLPCRIIDGEHVPLEGAELLTTNEMLNYKLPAHDIYFVAQWGEEIPTATVNTFVNGNGGTFIYCLNGVYTDNKGGFQALTAVGGTLRERGYSDIFEFNYEEFSKPFIGWKVCHTSEDGSLEQIGTELLTTEEMLDFIMPEYDVYFIAQWEGVTGDDSDDTDTPVDPDVPGVDNDFISIGEEFEGIADDTLASLKDAVANGTGSDDPVYSELAGMTAEELGALTVGKVYSTMLDEASVPKVERDKVMQLAGNISKIGQYYYISCPINSGNTSTGLELKKLSEPVEVVLQIPDELRDEDRAFGIINIYNGEAAGITSKTSRDGATLSFSTDKLGVFALVYTDPVPVDPDEEAVKETISDLKDSYETDGYLEGVTEKTEGAVKDAIDAGKDLTAELKSKKITEEQAKAEDEDLKNSINDIISELGDQGNLIGFYDISMVLKTDEEMGEELGTLDELSKPVSIEIDLPDNVPPVAEGYERSYFVYNFHYYSGDKIPAYITDGGNKITFSTDQFSIFALGYEDFKEGGKGVPITEEYFPDPVFREYVRGLDSRYEGGYHNDGYFYAPEEYSSNSIELNDMGIKDLTGIEYFSGLEYLECANNKLKKLDLSGIGLMDLSHVEAAGNRIEEVILNKSADYEELDLRYNNMESEDDIIVNGNTSFEDLYIYYFYPQGYCEPVAIDNKNFPDEVFREAVIRKHDNNKDGYFDPASECNTNFFEIDNYGITSLKGIEHFTRLQSLDCSKNELTELDISGLPNLSEINASENDLQSIKLSSIAPYDGSFHGFDVRYNQLSDIEDILSQSDCLGVRGTYFYPQGEKVDVEINETNFPDLALRTKLKNSYANENKDNILSGDELEALTDISLSGISDFTGLDKLTSARDIEFYQTSITKLPKLPKGVLRLYLGSNKLSSLEGAPATIQELYISNNNFTGTLDVSGFKYLKALHCDRNKIEKIILRDGAIFEALWADRNNMDTPNDIINGGNIEWDGNIFKFYNQNPECMKGEPHKYKSTVTKYAKVGISGVIRHVCQYGCGDYYDEDIIAVMKPVLSKTSYVYDGTTKVPDVKVEDVFDKVLEEGEDYTLTYSSGRKNVGRYGVTINFKGSYSGSYTSYFNILPKAPSTASVVLYGYDDLKFSWSKSTGASGYYVYYKTSSAKSYTYLGATTSTSYKKANLSDGVNYSFKVVPYYTYSGTKYASTAYKTASAYTLKKVSTPTVTKSGTKVKVKWTNINGESGYEISKSTSKTGISRVLTYATTTGTYKTLSATKNKTYYYRVRAYKTVGTTKIYGPWSDPKAYKRN